jgi:flavin reductase (DIM6/NTAB) family NADH-FMN oxidoreductase RutF
METAQHVKIDPREFRNTLGRFASGVTVITTEVEAQVYGMTANAFMSVSLDPPLVLISVDNRARMNTYLLTSRRYGVSILAEPHELFSRHFAGRPIEGLKIPFVKKLNMSVLENALACLIADVVEVYPAGDHTLYLGHVQYLEWQEEKPLLFFAGKYGQLHLEPGASALLPDDDPFFFHSHGGYPALPYSF